MMKFDPAIHTKAFLLTNAATLGELAKHDPQFAASSLAQDADILKLTLDSYRSSVAHYLARYQSEWLATDAAKDFDVLGLTDKEGWKVAHALAQYQPNWVTSDAAKNNEVLCWTKENSAWTVAHSLASHQPGWLRSEAAKKFTILSLESKYGWTVAHELVYSQPNCITHEPLFQKQILTLKSECKLLAEYITEQYGKSHGYDTPTMAVKLIEQGAAYIHAKPMDSSIGEYLIAHGHYLLNETMEPIIVLKQLQALYSTIVHNVSKINSSKEKMNLSEWNELLYKSETLIRQHLISHPKLSKVEHTIDIFCEPADELLKKICAEQALNATFTDILEHEPEHNPCEQGLY